MLEFTELKWEKARKRDEKEVKFCCPYCDVTVSTICDTIIYNVETGYKKYKIYKCPECSMPTTIGADKEIIPPSRFLPFEDIQHLPHLIEKMYCESRKCFSNKCYYSTVMVARTLVMYIAVNLGAESNLKFIEYIDYLEAEGYIAKHSRTWVNKIRLIGNQYVHEIEEATEVDANKVMIFIEQLLKNVYELPEMAK